MGRGELGGFVVRALESGVEFRLGYNHVLGGIDRVSLWLKREIADREARQVQAPAERREGSAAVPEVRRIPRGLGYVNHSWLQAGEPPGKTTLSRT